MDIDEQWAMFLKRGHEPSAVAASTFGTVDPMTTAVTAPGRGPSLVGGGASGLALRWRVAETVGRIPVETEDDDDQDSDIGDDDDLDDGEDVDPDHLMLDEVDDETAQWTKEAMYDLARPGLSSSSPLTRAPTPSSLYISTKTIISFLNIQIPMDIFWALPVMPFDRAEDGVVKKLIEIKSTSEEELRDAMDKFVQQVGHKECKLISHSDGVTSKRPYKDARKLSVGLSNKDVSCFRCKKIGAFQNCVVVLLRLWIDAEAKFREFHIKIFNTGKIEIVGVKQATLHAYVMQRLIQVLQPLFPATPLSYDSAKNEVVLINSNFSCRFFVDREKLYTILKQKYNLNCMYDPCSYPGIQCKYTTLMDEYMRAHGPETVFQHAAALAERPAEAAKSVNVGSFKIFRTGSVLIAGRCEEDVIMRAYQCICAILAAEFSHVYQSAIVDPRTEPGSGVPAAAAPAHATPYLHSLALPAVAATPQHGETARTLQHIMSAIKRTSGNKRKVHRKRSFVVLMDPARAGCDLPEEAARQVQEWDQFLDKKRMRVMGPAHALPPPPVKPVRPKATVRDRGGRTRAVAKSARATVKKVA